MLTTAMVLITPLVLLGIGIASVLIRETVWGEGEAEGIDLILFASGIIAWTAGVAFVAGIQ